MKLFRRIEATNVHGIYVHTPTITPSAIETAHKAILAIIETQASDPVKIEALKILVSLTSPAHKYEIRDCEIKMGA